MCSNIFPSIAGAGVPDVHTFLSLNRLEKFRNQEMLKYWQHAFEIVSTFVLTLWVQFAICHTLLTGFVFFQSMNGVLVQYGTPMSDLKRGLRAQMDLKLMLRVEDGGGGVREFWSDLGTLISCACRGTQIIAVISHPSKYCDLFSHSSSQISLCHLVTIYMQ